MNTHDQAEPTGSLDPIRAEDYQTLLESFAQAVWETDAQGMVVTDSLSWRAYTGQTLDEWLSEGWAGAVHPDERAYALSQWKEAVAHQRPVNAEFRLRTPYGGWRWTNIRATAIRSADGTITKWLGLTIDIPERKATQAQLQQHEQLLHTLLQYLPDGAAFVVDRQLRYQLAEGEALYQVGMKPGDFVGKTIFEALDADTAAIYEDQFRQVLMGESFTNEHQIHGHYFQSKGVPLCDANGNIDAVLVLSYDITERKKAEEALQKSEEQQGLLLRLSDMLRIMSDPADIQQAAMQLLGEQLGLSRIYYFSVERDDDGWVHVIDNAYQREPGGPSMIGRHSLKEFGSGLFEGFERGEVIAVSDITTVPVFSPEELASYQALEVRAFINVPLLQNGQYSAGIGAHHTIPHTWIPDEVALIREVVARTWMAVQRAYAEEALHHNEQMFSALVENAPFGVYMVDADFRLRQINAGSYEIFRGIEPLIGRDFAEILRIVWEESFAIEAIDRFRHTLRTGESFISPPIIEQRANLDEIQAYDWQIHRITLPDGYYGVVCYFYNLSGQKRLEEALRRSAERGSFLVTLSDALRPLSNPIEIQMKAARMLGEHLKVGRVAYAEIVGEEMIIHRDYTNGIPSIVGYYPKEAFGKRVMDALFETRSYLVANDVLADATLSAEEKEVYRATHIEAFVGATLYKAGNQAATLGVHSAVPREWTKDESELINETAERIWAAVEGARAEDALRDSRQRLQIVLDSIADHAIITTDTEGFITGWNPGAEQLFGWAAEEVLGQSAIIIFLPADRQTGVPEAEMRTAREQLKAANERYHQRKDGTQFYVSGVLSPLYDAEGQLLGYVKVTRDLSERQRMEQALRQADQRKDEFLAMLAHELRNPLAPIRNGLQLLALTNEGDQTLNSLLPIMNRQMDHLVRLVDDLLDVSRISRGKIELRKEPIDLTLVVGQAVEAMQPLYESSGRKLSIHLSNSPLYLNGDATRLNQVVTNLLTNGVRYTRENGQVWLSLEQDTGPTLRREAVLRVRDNGIGIAADQLSAIFELFVQVDNSLDRPNGSLGVGLTLVQQLVEMHGGRVEVHSSGLNQGSEFVVYLPILHP